MSADSGGPMSSQKAAVLDDGRLYEEAGRIWRHFASWREKLFAGYFTALAALTIGFTQNTTPLGRLVICCGSVLVSMVFWVMENRSRELTTACQLALDHLEQRRGCYAALNREGFSPHREFWLTYGFAVGLLVSGVTALSVAGTLVYGIKWWGSSPAPWSWGFGVVVALVSFPLLVWRLHAIAERRHEEQELRYRAVSSDTPRASPVDCL